MSYLPASHHIPYVLDCNVHFRIEWSHKNDGARCVPTQHCPGSSRQEGLLKCEPDRPSLIPYHYIHVYVILTCITVEQGVVSLPEPGRVQWVRV